MSIISPTNFINENGLPVDNIAIQSFIDKHEPKILRKILGYSLYKDFVAGLAEDIVLQKWLDLRDGKEYTYNENLEKYDGIYEIITDYVFFYISKSKQSESTDAGIKIANKMNMEGTSPREKQVFSYNEMVDLIVFLDEFILAANEDTEDTYEDYESTTIEKINIFNI